MKIRLHAGETVDAASTKRLFSAVAKTGDASLIKICRQLARKERDKGHTVLSRRLEQILDTAYKSSSRSPSTARSIASLGEFALGNERRLPRSQRKKDPLVQLVPREELRHHVVFAPEVMERYERIIREYAARKRLAQHGLAYKKKILVYGPPGCGKTLSAEYLAWSTGLPLIKVRFDALISSFFGESAANLRDVFEWAANTPSVLFLDECDFIAKSRSAGNDIGEVTRIVNTLLTLLEEYDSKGLLFAATNLTTSLDKALFRRFDEVFEVGAPGETEIRALLDLNLGIVRLRSKSQVDRLAKGLKGMPASAVVAAAREAVATAVLESREVLADSDIELALSRVKSQYLE